MSALLLTALLVVAAEDAPKVEGKWLIVYAEEGGNRQSNWETKVATLKGNGLTFERDGKDQTLDLAFGDNQTVKASGLSKDGKASGVYILGQDYLCLSLNSTAGKGDGKSSGSFILILRRQR